MRHEIGHGHVTCENKGNHARIGSDEEEDATNDLDHALNIVRPTAFVGSGRHSERLRYSANAGGVLCVARRCKASPSQLMDISTLGVANADGVFQHTCKYRQQIAWRAADDLQYLRRGRLRGRELGAHREPCSQRSIQGHRLA